ncbi:MAG: hypothetical protein KY475_06805 [Planctomycetes bacterium]|nr:hypothetical protein [Planctomycetota bacterium]
MKIPIDLRTDRLLALVDTREQAPLDLTPLRVERASLPTGDYSLRGLESVAAIERKSREDLIACIGRERARFDREVRRLLAYPVRALVVESTWPEIESGGWRGDVQPEAAINSLLGWIATGLPVVMARDRIRAGRYVARLLILTARRWRESRALLGAVLEGETSPDQQTSAYPSPIDGAWCDGAAVGEGDGLGCSLTLARPATAGQVRVIVGMAKRRGVHLGNLLREQFHVERAEDLSVPAASSLIDALKRDHAR